MASSGGAIGERVRDGLRTANAPQLLVGGSADPTWDGPLARTFPHAEILELPDADHSLETADTAMSIDLLERVTAAIADFVGGIGY